MGTEVVRRRKGCLLAISLFTISHETSSDAFRRRKRDIYLPTMRPSRFRLKYFLCPWIFKNGTLVADLKNSASANHSEHSFELSSLASLFTILFLSTRCTSHGVCLMSYYWPSVRTSLLLNFLRTRITQQFTRSRIQSRAANFVYVKQREKRSRYCCVALTSVHVFRIRGSVTF